MILNMSPAVIFFSKDITLRQAQVGSWVNGRFVKPVPAFIDKTIKATVQPATSKDLMILPEAERRKQVIAVWALEFISMSGDSATTVSDHLIVDGISYKVIHAFNRLDNKFFKVLAEFLPND